MFERIQRVTAVEKYLKEHADANQEQALEACKTETFRRGVNLRRRICETTPPRPLRSDDPRVLIADETYERDHHNEISQSDA